MGVEEELLLVDPTDGSPRAVAGLILSESDTDGESEADNGDDSGDGSGDDSGDDSGSEGMVVDLNRSRHGHGCGLIRAGIPDLVVRHQRPKQLPPARHWPKYVWAKRRASSREMSPVKMRAVVLGPIPVL